MSDRKRNEGWRAENPNRHKREEPGLEFMKDFFSEGKKKANTRLGKAKRK